MPAPGIVGECQAALADFAFPAAGVGALIRPASLMVGARFGIGWTLNFGKPAAWLLIAGFAAWWAGLAAFGVAAGM
jgi:hypothetical protein